MSAREMCILASGTLEGECHPVKVTFQYSLDETVKHFLKSIKSLFMVGMFEIQKINAIRNASMFEASNM